MNFRTCTLLFLLAVLLAARLLDVHFHLPSKASGALAHVVAVTLDEADQHHHEAPDHGHIASHLYEGETDEKEGAGLLATLNLAAVFLVPMVLGFLGLTWSISGALPLPLRADESPPRPRRWARNSPPSQAPPRFAR